MRNVLVLFALLVAWPAHAATYYVSTTGSDAANGSMGTPWLTIQKACDTVSAGDTVNILAGTYQPVATRDFGVRCTTNGSSGLPITFQGSGGRPVLNCSSITASAESTCFDLDSDWFVLKDIDVTLMPGVGETAGVKVTGNNVTVRNVRSSAHEGLGFMLGNGVAITNLLVVNCDAFDNYDPLNNGQGADGYQMAGVTGTGNIIEYSRSWDNSDDGFDIWETETVVTLRYNWAWSNGFDMGDGTGFKLGRNDTSPLHIIHRNVAFDNDAAGFDTNSAAGPLQFYQNTSFNNGTSDYVINSLIAHVLTNNIGRDATNPPAAAVDTFNSWNLAVAVSAADFRSVSAALAEADRGSDGSLPVNDLFRLVLGSDLIDVGTDIGQSYSGAAPDLGAWEFEALHAGRPNVIRRSRAN